MSPLGLAALLVAAAGAGGAEVGPCGGAAGGSCAAEDDGFSVLQRRERSSRGVPAAPAGRAVRVGELDGDEEAVRVLRKAARLEYLDYQEVWTYYRALERLAPERVRVYSARQLFPLAAAFEGDGTAAQREEFAQHMSALRCGAEPCDVPVVLVGALDERGGAASAGPLPRPQNEPAEVAAVGLVHGDEKMGVQVLAEAARLLAFAGAEPSSVALLRERLLGGAGAGAAPQGAGPAASALVERELAYLARWRSAWLVPFANPHGYFHDTREELAVDPNRDAPYGNTHRTKSGLTCLQTFTTRTLHALLNSHLFHNLVNFHAGTRAMVYPFGGPNHLLLHPNGTQAQRPAYDGTRQEAHPSGKPGDEAPAGRDQLVAQLLGEDAASADGAGTAEASLHAGQVESAGDSGTGVGAHAPDWVALRQVARRMQLAAGGYVEHACMSAGDRVQLARQAGPAGPCGRVEQSACPGMNAMVSFGDGQQVHMFEELRRCPEGEEASAEARQGPEQDVMWYRSVSEHSTDIYWVSGDIMDWSYAGAWEGRGDGRAPACPGTDPERLRAPSLRVMSYLVETDNEKQPGAEAILSNRSREAPGGSLGADPELYRNERDQGLVARNVRAVLSLFEMAVPSVRVDLQRGVWYGAGCGVMDAVRVWDLCGVSGGDASAAGPAALARDAARYRLLRTFAGLPCSGLHLWEHSAEEDAALGPAPSLGDAGSRALRAELGAAEAAAPRAWPGEQRLADLFFEGGVGEEGRRAAGALLRQQPHCLAFEGQFDQHWGAGPGAFGHNADTMAPRGVPPQALAVRARIEDEFEIQTADGEHSLRSSRSKLFFPLAPGAAEFQGGWREAGLPRPPPWGAGGAAGRQ